MDDSNAQRTPKTNGQRNIGPGELALAVMVDTLDSLADSYRAGLERYSSLPEAERAQFDLDTIESFRQLGDFGHDSARLWGLLKTRGPEATTARDIAAPPRARRRLSLRRLKVMGIVIGALAAVVAGVAKIANEAYQLAKLFWESPKGPTP